MSQEEEPKLYVCAKRCDQCLYSSARIVPQERAEGLIAEARERGSHFICHKHTIRAGANVACRGFFDAEHTLEIMLARSLGIIVFVDEEGNPVEGR